MTVIELIEKLQDYGGHVDVQMKVVNKGGAEFTFKGFTVEDTVLDDNAVSLEMTGVTLGIVFPLANDFS